MTSVFADTFYLLALGNQRDECHERAMAFSSQFDKDWSLTDCISFVVMVKLKITDALTADHHFEQAGFNALLK